jgi:hypothetical protein
MALVCQIARTLSGRVSAWMSAQTPSCLENQPGRGTVAGRTPVKYSFSSGSHPTTTCTDDRLRDTRTRPSALSTGRARTRNS